jgi:hypothetical protein
VKVELKDTVGNYHEVYSEQPELLEECPYRLSIPIILDYQVDTVKITIDQSVLSSDWNEIDAVELVGAPGGASLPPSSEPTTPAGGISISDVPPGGFGYEVSGADEDKVVESGYIQHQSTTSEYVIGLMEAGNTARYFLSLFLPLDIAPGKFEITPYDKSSPTHGPGAAIMISAWFYYADKGVFTIESVSGDTISGRFQFTAIHESNSERVITVTGSFNQIPLESE